MKIEIAKRKLFLSVEGRKWRNESATAVTKGILRFKCEITYMPLKIFKNFPCFG